MFICYCTTGWIINDVMPHVCTLQAEEDTNGFQSANYVLSKVINRPECRWISLTSANNAYGSEVVSRVLNVAPSTMGKHKKYPDLLLAPLDSKFYGKQGTSFIFWVFFCLLFIFQLTTAVFCWSIKYLLFAYRLRRAEGVPLGPALHWHWGDVEAQPSCIHCATSAFPRQGGVRLRLHVKRENATGQHFVW